jgi:hypothetical protein
LFVLPFVHAAGEVAGERRGVRVLAPDQGHRRLVDPSDAPFGKGHDQLQDALEVGFIKFDPAEFGEGVRGVQGSLIGHG